MAAFNFPNSPSTNDTHTENGITFQWNGTVWKKLTGTSGAGMVPSGCILIWSGNSGNIPSGWTLCNGSNGTPDLRGRFVVGFDNNDGDFGIADTGGSKDAVVVAHTHSDGNYGTNDPGGHTHGDGNYTAGSSGSAHSHTYVDQVGANEGYRPWKAGDNDCGARNKETDTDGTHSHSITGSSGSGGSHTHNVTGTSGGASGEVSGGNKNLPPYYALCYIMKT